ncbi:hypothetical protein GLOTRDRAFT_30984 [Gloeophyllum trabeum ATCC 11539]|uniref:Mitochondrial presequence protease n=1 Tax=Gloeophyllum trabeum (strain ATCC 11539 / FP-39264 / Madison 617) TaxID=670483 RepID=S7QMC6_GLOTA|nr:uncharacterized protein GLOTRDRAFT_30984 [Gloeophyllum trabeum ATCC 11539]EPQ60716.1 hypothetical protein GLOTRDRAFT_30984 [Gloeophyllum trabeum ATCC 11539]
MSPSVNGSAVAAEAVQTLGNYDLVRRFKLDFSDVVVSKWKSRTTGLTVVHLDYEAPIVNGYFVVATEIFDDSGCPHTLEHLVFMGSEKYPYKGIIDHLANRGFSNGTNAWTDTDHTAYTVSTAGEQGFLQLLPIYVDHILYPTLTKAGFVTEVHHVDGEGHDSGVVYSEMQGRENTAGDLMALKMQRLLNPPGSAYRSETGGLMEALRVLTIEQIRKYHGTYYVPHNLSLIICGKLSSGTNSLLKLLQEQVEPRIVEHGQNKGVKPPGWKRPFVETASAIRPGIKANVVEHVEFPEKDESVGEVMISYVGPPPNAFIERKALDILSTYLTSSPVAPLNKEYIETESPLCTYIYFGEDTRATHVDLPIYIGSVPTEHIDTFSERLRSSFKRIAQEGFDMERMSMVINRDERQLLSKLESAKGDTFSGTVITDFLYGKEDASELLPAMDEINYYNALKKWTNQDWVKLLQRLVYYIDPPSVTVVGKPSAAMADKLEVDEKVRIAAQKEKLGPEGLKEKARELEEAKKEHEKPIPTDILTAFPVPDVKSISWITVKSIQEGGKGRLPSKFDADPELVKHISTDGQQLPFFVQYDHVHSEFVTIHAYFSLAKLPNRLRPYLSAYLASFFSLPIKRSTGEELTHEEVVNKLDNETVSYEVNLGTAIPSGFPELLRVSIKTEAKMYENGVAWLKDLIYGSKFDKERLQVTVAKIQQSLPELKRDGSTVMQSFQTDLIYDESSSTRAGGLLAQMDFIPSITQRLQESPEAVALEFEELRKYVTEPSGIRFAVAGNILDLPQPRSIWRKHFGSIIPETPLAPVKLSQESLSPVGRYPVKKAVVVSLPTIESSFVTHTTKGIQGFAHPEYPALRVASEVLNATESYLWRYIRGSGLAYGAYVSADTEAGLISFSLYRSSNAIQGFEQAGKVVRGLVDGSIELDSTTIDAAKSSIVYGVAKAVSTASRAAAVSFSNQALKGLPQDYNVKLLEKYQAITKEDVLESLRKHFLPLFDASSSIAVVATAPGKADQISEGLTKFGFQVEKRTLQVDPEELDGMDEDGSESSDSEESGESR